MNSGFPKISDEELPLLFELTGRHPYLLQGIIEKVWPDQTEWTRETVEQAGAEFLSQHKDFERWFDKFTPMERDFYRCPSDAWPGSASLDHIAQKMNLPKRKAREALTLLAYHGILDASDINALKIAGTLFRGWYMENHTAPCPPNDTQENNMKVFISYAPEDFETANRLYNDLKASNIKPWLDRHDLLPGQKWKLAIREAIKNSDYYLILLSSQSISKRGFVQKEMRMALDILDEFPQSDIFIIPVRLDECEPLDERLQDLHAVDLFPAYEDGLSKVLRVLTTVQDGETETPPATQSTEAAQSIPSAAPSAPLFDSSRKIKILFLASSPTDTARLRLDEELRKIKQRIRLAEFRDRFDIVSEWAVRVDDLQTCLLRHQPDIIHFGGHGESGEILVENNGGISQAVPARALSMLFSLLRDNIRCVVLNACYSEPQARSIAEHIDYVVGMSTAIGDRAAISFAASFYQALGFGRDIRTAFELGRVQIDMEGLDEQDTPQLLTGPDLETA